METHAAPSTRVLVKVEQRVLTTVTSKNQVDSAKKKFQGWRCGITEGKPVSEKQMAFGYKVVATHPDDQDRVRSADSADRQWLQVGKAPTRSPSFYERFL